MGYWEQNEEGVSFAGANREPEPLMWGDQPADVIDDALWKVKALFLKDLGRLPSQAEIMAGLTFSTRDLELPDRPENSPHADEGDLKALDSHYYAATGGDEPVKAGALMGRRIINEIIDRLTNPFKDSS